MKHLDEDLYAAAQMGEHEAKEIARAVRRLNRAVEVLHGFDVCPGCVVTEVEHRFEHLGVDLVPPEHS